MLGFYVEGGGFAHEHGGELDDIATEQSYYSLVSYSRFLSGKTTLYDMSDVKITQTTETGDNNGQSGGVKSRRRKQFNEYCNARRWKDGQLILA